MEKKTICKHFPVVSIREFKGSQPDNDTIVDLAIQSLWLQRKDCEVRAVTDGHVHYVYFVRHAALHPSGIFLKIRRSHFSSRPDIRICPADIEIEGNVVEYLWGQGGASPRLLWKNYSLGVIAMECVGTWVRSLEELLICGDFDERDAFATWEAIWKLHFNLRGYKSSRNFLEEEEFYKNNLYYRFGILNEPTLDSFVEDLYHLPRSIIHADLTPRNIFINSATKTASFIDFETTHYGNLEFDTAFFKAHLLLHNWHNWSKFERLAESFDDWYRKERQLNTPWHPIIECKLILSTLLYRASSDFKYTLSSNVYEFAKRWLRKNIVNFADIKNLRQCFPS